MRKILESTTENTVKIIFDRADGSSQFDVSIIPCDRKQIPKEIATLLLMVIDTPRSPLAALVDQVVRSGIRRQFDISEFADGSTGRLNELDFLLQNHEFLGRLNIQPESVTGRLADAIGKQISHNIREIQTPDELFSGFNRLMSRMTSEEIVNGVIRSGIFTRPRGRQEAPNNSAQHNNDGCQMQ